MGSTCEFSWVWNIGRTVTKGSEKCQNKQSKSMGCVSWLNIHPINRRQRNGEEDKSEDKCFEEFMQEIILELSKYSTPFCCKNNVLEQSSTKDTNPSKFLTYNNSVTSCKISWGIDYG